MPKSILILFCLIPSVLIGCSAIPSKKQLANADFGLSISQYEAQSKATIWLKSHLKDPNSAQIDWGKISPGWVRDALIGGGSFQFGYKLSANVNAKNSYGGYAGYTPYIFLFYNGQFKRILGQRELDSGLTYLSRYK